MHKTFRQWPENLIMPATARNRMYVMHYGVAESMAKQMKQANYDRQKALEKVTDWLVDEATRLWCKNMPQNVVIYRDVASTDMSKYFDEVWS